MQLLPDFVQRDNPAIDLRLQSQSPINWWTRVEEHSVKHEAPLSRATLAIPQAQLSFSGGQNVNIVLISSSYPPPPDLHLRSDFDPQDKSPLYLQGGIAVHVEQLAKALARRSHSVMVFAWSPRFDEVNVEDGVTICRLSVPKRATNSAYPTSEEVPALERRFRERIDELILRRSDYPEIIHCHHSVAFPAAAGLRQATGAKLISTAHILMCSPSFPYLGDVPAETRESELNMCSSSDHVIAVSGWVRDSIVKELGISYEQIDVVHNGIDPGDQIVDSDVLEEWRVRFAPNGERVVAYAGRLSAEKGVAGFIEAIRLLLQKVPSAIILIAGGYAEEIEAIRAQFADATFLSDHLVFLGWVSQTELLYLRTLAEVFVIPSLYDPFPYAALESMAAGVPVVCSDAGGLPEMVEDKKSGLVVPLKDIGGKLEVDSSGLAEAIMLLLADQPLRLSLATSARNRVVTEFNIEAMTSNVMSVYEST